jgi:excisionase family DNA binding protein
MDKMLTTKEAGLLLNVTPARIRQFVMRGQLPASRFGRDLVIKRSDLDKLKDRKVGRPKKEAA